MANKLKTTPNLPSPGPTGSGYLLIKEMNGERHTLSFRSEKELREHLEAMWKFTLWSVVSICKQ